MRRRLLSSFVLGPLSLALCTAAFGLILLEGEGAAEEPRARDEEQVAKDDVQDLVYLGPGRPVLVRLHLRIDGKPFQAVYRAATEDYVKELFPQLDRNGDGFLSAEEAKLLPAPVLMTRGGGGNAVNVAFNYRVVDTDGDGKVSLAELTDYYAQFGAGPLNVQFAPGQLASAAALNDALFALLDADKDGKLSKDELAAADKLFDLDADGDELLTPAELATKVYPNANPGQPVFQPGSTTFRAERFPFVVLTPGEDAGGLANRILAQYGPRQSLTGKKLTREEVGMDKSAFERLDADHDGKLDAAELEKFADRPADLELIVRLGKTAGGEKTLEVVNPEGRVAPLAAAVRTSPEGTLLLTLDRAQVEIRCNDGKPQPTKSARQLYLQQFQAADTGKKGHLTKKDALQHSFFPNQFALLDRDGDGKLTEKELLTYLDRVQEAQARAVTGVPCLLISDEGTGLFELLDRNRDGRLGRREVRAAPGLIARLDRDGDGQLSREEIVRSHQLALGLCLASFNRSGGTGVFAPPSAPLLSLDWAGVGPVWFNKMDRNRDGDVSPREFLGSREHFRKIDADGDGLISLDEAVRAADLLK